MVKSIEQLEISPDDEMSYFETDSGMKFHIQNIQSGHFAVYYVTDKGKEKHFADVEKLKHAFFAATMFEKGFQRCQKEAKKKERKAMLFSSDSEQDQLAAIMSIVNEKLVEDFRAIAKKFFDENDKASDKRNKNKQKILKTALKILTTGDTEDNHKKTSTFVNLNAGKQSPISYKDANNIYSLYEGTCETTNTQLQKNVSNSEKPSETILQTDQIDKYTKLADALNDAINKIKVFIDTNPTFMIEAIPIASNLLFDNRFAVTYIRNKKTNNIYCITIVKETNYFQVGKILEKSEFISEIGSIENALISIIDDNNSLRDTNNETTSVALAFPDFNDTCVEQFLNNPITGTLYKVRSTFTKENDSDVLIYDLFHCNLNNTDETAFVDTYTTKEALFKTVLSK